MQHAMFHPGQESEMTDPWSKKFIQIAQWLLVGVFGLLPILFIPSVTAPFGYSKVLLAVFGVSFALLFYSLAVLRDGAITVKVPLVLSGFWFVALVSVIAALFSGDFTDAFIGVDFAPQTAAFTMLLAATASAVTILRSAKMNIIRLYFVITISAILLGAYHVLRVFLGPDFLSLGVISSSVASPIGGWNDLALFFGLAVILAMVAVEQLPLSTVGKWILGVTTFLSLFMLAVVNFFAVWLILGLVSLIMLMYVLTKHRFSQVNFEGVSAEVSNSSFMSVILALSVFVVSVIFMIGGSALGGIVSKAVDFQYVQVSPSFSATFDIARSVYSDSAFVGIGPNKFGDAWRLYKDETINQTVYWNTTFNSGNGYVTTNFVTTGLFGVVAWLLFLGTLLYGGFKLVFRPDQSDRVWQFIATSSFVSAVYLWGMSIIYVPTASMLLLAAVCTGVMCAAISATMPVRSCTLSVTSDRRAGFVLVALVMVIIIGSVGVLYFVGRHYAALYSFNNALTSITSGTDIETVEQGIVGAYQISNDDLFARQIAGYQLARLNALLTLPEPNEQQVQQFQQVTVNGINAAQLAVTNDATEPLNWQLLGQIYSALTAADVEGSYDRAKEAFSNAREFDPKNPSYALLEAQLEIRTGNLEAGRLKAEEAIAMKRDYTEALVLLAEINIAEGDLTQAVARTEAIVSIEPNNPARWYQLGLLYSAADNQDQAVAAFSSAVSLDPNYANARYLLAILLAERGEVDAAIGQLEVVQELNQDNTQLEELITTLREEGALPEAVAPEEITEPETIIETDDGQVTTTAEPDTDLITPVNTVPDSNGEAELTETVRPEVETSAAAQ